MTVRIRHEIRQITVRPDVSINECIAMLDRTGMGVLAVCDEQHKLLGIITDGDIRRALLKRLSLDEPCITIASTNPLSVLESISPSDALKLMNHRKVDQLPILDANGLMIDLVLRLDLQQTEVPGVRAVVMAGGFGSRLLPLTENTPKPMLALGGRPVMEHIVRQLRDAGISSVNVTTHYLPEKIRMHFGDGSDFDVSINYIEESSPLGTAGSLSLVEAGDEPILVINGDILTKVDFRSMITFHRKHKADLTVGVRLYDLKVPYGVLDCDDMLVTAVNEKPTQKFLVNAGIYLLEPNTYECIPKNTHYNMTDLMQHLIETGKRVVSFPVIEYWMDIGQVNDYEKAKDDMESWVIDR